MARIATVLGIVGFMACGAAHAGPGQGILPEAAVMAAHPLAAQINGALERQRPMSGFQPTGLKRDDYLRIVDGEVRAMRAYQNAEGRIIDPIKKAEYYYTTPCYAHAVATLVASGYRTDAGLLESGARAMDAATADLARGCPTSQSHGDFYTYPLLLALPLFEKVARRERCQEWIANLRRLEPKKAYKSYAGAGGNWTVVHTAGEFLRAVRGMTDADYVEHALDIQRPHLTPLGMYREHGEPFAYDAFPRYFLTGMLHLGYQGGQFAFYRDACWRGAWTSLLIQSPFGELPTGYRSAHHIWNEAELAAIYELYARHYAAAGRPAEAGAFKRGARLALACVGRWIRPDGSGYIVKNRYPIEAEHGYEKYSVHTCYNMLACSMLAAAWSFADDTIAELPAPADVGGFVVSLPDFHMVVAHAGGAYVQYMTRGNQVYNPTGLIRIHLRGAGPQLGPSDGVVNKTARAEDLRALAVGPAWRTAQGKEVRLAEFGAAAPRSAAQKEESPLPAADLAVIEESPRQVRFRMTVDHQGAHVVETLTLNAEGVRVEDEVSGAGVNALRIYYPALVFDGAQHAQLTLRGAQATLTLGQAGIRFQIEQPSGAQLQRLGLTMNHRNGQVEPLFADVRGLRAVYCIRALGRGE